jgi:hypothetical protein
LACIKSGLPIVTFVVQGVQQAAFQTLDRQKMRRNSDDLAILDRAAGEIRDIAVSLAPQEPMPLSPDPMEDETDVVPF